MAAQTNFRHGMVMPYNIVTRWTGQGTLMEVPWVSWPHAVRPFGTVPTLTLASDGLHLTQRAPFVRRVITICFSHAPLPPPPPPLVDAAAPEAALRAAHMTPWGVASFGAAHLLTNCQHALSSPTQQQPIHPLLHITMLQYIWRLSAAPHRLAAGEAAALVQTNALRSCEQDSSWSPRVLQSSPDTNCPCPESVAV